MSNGEKFLTAAGLFFLFWLALAFFMGIGKLWCKAVERLVARNTPAALVAAGLLVSVPGVLFTALLCDGPRTPAPDLEFWNVATITAVADLVAVLSWWAIIMRVRKLHRAAGPAAPPPVFPKPSVGPLLPAGPAAAAAQVEAARARLRLKGSK